jgi:hypothetical protein
LLSSPTGSAAESSSPFFVFISLFRVAPVNEIQKAIHSLKESWSDLISDQEEKKKKSKG